MDLTQVPTTTLEGMEKHLEELLKHRQTLVLSTEKSKGQKAQNKASSSELRLMFQPAAREAQKLAKTIGYYEAAIGGAYPPCTIPPADLKSISINELRLETAHRGYVLVVCTIENPLRHEAVMNVIVDRSGGTDRISVYNFDPNLKDEDVLPNAAYFAVKEPYYTATLDGRYMVCIDHPSDLVQLKSDKDLAPLQPQPTASDWKHRGNKEYHAKRYRAAVSLYTRGLKHGTSSSPGHLILDKLDLYHNRALANFYLHRYEAALEDAVAAEIPDSAQDISDIKRREANRKAYYRAGRAAYCLGDFKQAQKYLEEADLAIPDDADTVRELKRTGERLVEQSDGLYDFNTVTKAITGSQPNADVANFLRRVEVRETADRGRGVLAIDDIKADELIFCEKAFSIAPHNEASTERRVMATLDTHIGATELQKPLRWRTVQKLLNNPKQAREVLNLYDGGYEPKSGRLVDSSVALDTFQVQAIVNFNAFGCRTKEYSTDSETKFEERSSSGLWLMASYVNHDCVGNACRSFIGDLMVVYATNDIKKGSEILWQYRVPEADHTMFQEKVQNSWNFKCPCLVCSAEAEMTDLQRKRRTETIEDIKKFLDANVITSTNVPTTITIGEAEKLHQRLSNTYDPNHFRDLPLLRLSMLTFWLTEAYASRSSESRARSYALAVLHELGFQVSVKKSKLTIQRKNCVVSRIVVLAALYLAEMYRKYGRVAVAEQFGDFARRTYVTCYGSMIGFREDSGIVELAADWAVVAGWVAEKHGLRFQVSCNKIHAS